MITKLCFKKLKGECYHLKLREVHSISNEAFVTHECSRLNCNIQGWFLKKLLLESKAVPNKEIRNISPVTNDGK
jgi:hypothetical protein